MREQARFEDLARIHNMIVDLRGTIYKTRINGVSQDEEATLVEVSALLGSPMLAMDELIERRRAVKA